MWKKERYAEPATELGSAIEIFFKKFGYEREYYQGKAMNEWAEIMGSALASRAKIASFEGLVLTIKTENSIWKNEIFLRKAEIIKLMNDRYNYKIVSEIYIK
jgi:hypothetical protein